MKKEDIINRIKASSFYLNSTIRGLAEKGHGFAILEIFQELEWRHDFSLQPKDKLEAYGALLEGIKEAEGNQEKLLSVFWTAVKQKKDSFEKVFSNDRSNQWSTMAITFFRGINKGIPEIFTRIASDDNFISFFLEKKEGRDDPIWLFGRAVSGGHTEAVERLLDIAKSEDLPRVLQTLEEEKWGLSAGHYEIALAVLSRAGRFQEATGKNVTHQMAPVLFSEACKREDEKIIKKIRGACDDQQWFGIFSKNLMETCKGLDKELVEKILEVGLGDEVLKRKLMEGDLLKETLEIIGKRREDELKSLKAVEDQRKAAQRSIRESRKFIKETNEARRKTFDQKLEIQQRKTLIQEWKDQIKKWGAESGKKKATVRDAALVREVIEKAQEIIEGARGTIKETERREEAKNVMQSLQARAEQQAAQPEAEGNLAEQIEGIMKKIFPKGKKGKKFKGVLREKVKEYLKATLGAGKRIDIKAVKETVRNAREKGKQEIQTLAAQYDVLARTASSTSTRNQSFRSCLK